MTRWAFGGLVLVLAAAAGVAQTRDALYDIEIMLGKRRPNPFGGGPPVLAPLAVGLRPQPPAPAPAGPPRLDAGGDPLPAGAVARYGTVRLRHGVEPDGLDFSADGKFLVSTADIDDGVRVWDPTSGKELHRLNARAELVALARDGSVLVVDGDQGRHWVPASGVLRDLPEGAIPGGARAVAVSPDVRSFAVGVPGRVALVDLRTGKQLHELKHPPDKVATRLGFSPDGRWLAGSGDDTGVWLWDLRTFKRVRTYDPEADEPWFAFSPDGSRIVVAEERLRVYPTDAEEPLDGFGSPEGEFKAPRFSADGRWVFVMNEDGDAFQIDAATGEVKETWKAPAENLSQPMAVGPDAAVVAAVDGEGGIRIWDPRTGKGPEVDRLPDLYTPGFSPDGKTVWCFDFDNRIHGFDPATGKRVKLLELPLGAELFGQWDPVTRRAAGFVDGDAPFVQVVDVDTGKELAKLPVPAGVSNPQVSFCPTDRTRMALFLPGCVEVVNPATGVRSRTLRYGKQDDDPAGRGAISPDGRLVAVNSRPFAVWEVATGKKRFEFDGLPPAEGVAFSRDGRLLAVWEDEDVAIIDVRFGTVVGKARAGHHAGLVQGVAFSPDNKRIAVADDEGTVAVWEVASGDSVVTFRGHDGCVNGVAWSPDGTRLASACDDGTVLVWEVPGKPGDAPAVAAVGGFDDAFRLLASADAAAAQRGVEFLYRRPAETPKQCADRVPLPAAAPAGRIGKLIGELGDEDFAVRQAAAKGLEALGGEAAAALRQAAAMAESPEARKRAGELVTRIEAAPATADDLRAMRAVEVLEGLATADAKAVLAKWAAGVPGHRLTTEAATALARMKAGEK